MSNLMQQSMAGEKWSAGVAYVALPKDIDRATYISECYKQGLISIRSEDGGFYNRVPVGRHIWDFIEFPEKADQNGSTIFYALEPVHKQPVALAIISSNNEIVDLVEHQFKIKRKYNNNFVEVAGSAKGGYISINVDAEKNAQLLINVRNKNATAKLDVVVDGEIILQTTGDMTTTRYGEYLNQTFDQNDESQSASHKQTSSTNEFQNDKFSINDGSNPMARGNDLKSLIDDLLDLLYQATTPTQNGLQYLTNRDQIHALKDRTKNFLSQVSFTD